MINDGVIDINHDQFNGQTQSPTSSYAEWLTSKTTKLANSFEMPWNYLKKNRDIYGGFLREEDHYIFGASVNSSILWNVKEILKEFHYRGRLIRKGQDLISELQKEVLK